MTLLIMLMLLQYLLFAFSTMLDLGITMSGPNFNYTGITAQLLSQHYPAVFLMFMCSNKAKQYNFKVLPHADVEFCLLLPLAGAP